jgi:hypothetical protein
MAIRFDKALNTEIRRVVKNYNRRVAKMKSEEKDLDIDFVKVSDLKKQFARRRDLMFELKRLDTIRGDASSVAKAALKAETRAKIKVTYNIKRLKAEEGTPRFTALKADRLATEESIRKALNKDSSKMTGVDKRKYNQLVERINKPDPERQQKFYDKFFDMLLTSLYHTSVYGDDAAYLQEQLSKLTPDQLLKAYNESNFIRDIVDAYHDFIEEQLKQGDDKIKLDEYGQIDNSLDGYVKALFKNVDSLVEEFKNR